MKAQQEHHREEKKPLREINSQSHRFTTATSSIINYYTFGVGQVFIPVVMQVGVKDKVRVDESQSHEISEEAEANKLQFFKLIISFEHFITTPKLQMKQFQTTYSLLLEQTTRKEKQMNRTFFFLFFSFFLMLSLLPRLSFGCPTQRALFILFFLIETTMTVKKEQLPNNITSSLLYFQITKSSKS